MVMIGDEHN